MFGAGGGTSSYQEIHETDVIVLWGSNAREAHPIFFHHLLRGIDNGAAMYCVDPRRTSSAKFADAWLGLSVGTDIALANAAGRDIIANGWQNAARSSPLDDRVRGVRSLGRALHARMGRADHRGAGGSDR